ncbi:urea amidolyase associated protein UAAP1 [Peribacillus sp. NPDC046944]|uniref:urea amidolyase associated protein UAAP1 n=1 Tax=unclassified Peribacillus TaxID=2675266 RepID=UPI003CFFBEE8
MQQTSVIVSKVIPAGGKWSAFIKRGKEITFTVSAEQANVSLLLFNAHDLAERYNMPDSLKAQYTAFFTKHNVLMSDQGRVLASITEDSVGWHDTIGGYSTKAQIDSQFGETTYQESRNERYRNGEDNLLIELFRNGLSRQDLGPVVNLFSKVSCDDAGYMHLAPDHVKAGDTVTLRTEMDVFMALSNTPHPLSEATTYPQAEVTVEVKDTMPATGDDPCVLHRDENKRAYENTWEYVQLTQGGVL